ncbi:hypothetical protein GCM10010124_09240 [Pilimelia terevasa]|uniref:NodB homology domain-containing protein n=1 Tax=Pilimelia terevasa TaxID=53372 RepID=A0A8J3FGW5_9ACTN|nr:polysaccharide deacetylase family protein [Pilimelia terevasa]GGK18770.1 hypothetical protein GCM10010124_09240 [Pilimelia terevasa]
MDGSGGVPPRRHTMPRGVDRRALLRGAGLLGCGVGLGAVGAASGAGLLERRLPILGGPASATVADRGRHPGQGRLDVMWSVRTPDRLVALTFDDGPRPDWTTFTLDTLAAHDVPATFFFVGERVRRHAAVVRGRMGRHEVGSHSWRHADLATLDADAVHTDLARAHAAIAEVTGQQPRLFRPPYGHLGGATLLAASRFDYQVVLWSLQMLESQYPGDPAGHARDLAARVEPGAVLLAHDVGPADRLVALRGLPQFIAGVRARGFRFVTVTQLLRAGHPIG